MKYSSLAPYGLLRFSTRPSRARSIYEAMKRNYGTGYDFTEGTVEEAKVFARAKGLGAARATLERAANVQDPLKIQEMLPAVEHSYDLTPSETDSLHTRRAALAIARRIPRGARRESVEDALRSLLGNDFRAYRTFTAAEVTVEPADPSTGPGAFNRPDLPARVLAFVEPVPNAGVHEVLYENHDTTLAAEYLREGDVVTVQPENSGLAEKVTVTSVSGDEDARLFTATFTKPHCIGAVITTAPCPLWWSTQRSALIVVNPSFAVSAETRRKIDAIMLRMARGVSQWAIVAPAFADDSNLPPFTLGTSPLGTTTVEVLYF